MYNKNSILSGRHVSTFIRSSSGPLGKQIQELSIFQCIVGSQMLTDCQGDMFRPLLGHLQALWENRSKSYLYLNTLWDPKCLQIVRATCFDLYWVIYRPSGKTDPRTVYISMHCGIPNANRLCYMNVKCISFVLIYHHLR